MIISQSDIKNIEKRMYDIETNIKKRMDEMEMNIFGSCRVVSCRVTKRKETSRFVLFCGMPFGSCCLNRSDRLNSAVSKQMEMLEDQIHDFRS